MTGEVFDKAGHSGAVRRGDELGAGQKMAISSAPEIESVPGRDKLAQRDAG